MIYISIETKDDGYSRDVLVNDNHQMYDRISSSENHFCKLGNHETKMTKKLNESIFGHPKYSLILDNFWQVLRDKFDVHIAPSSDWKQMNILDKNYMDIYHQYREDKFSLERQIPLDEVSN